MSAALMLGRLLDTELRVVRRLRRHGVMPHLLGLWVRRHFHRAGVVLACGGFPLASIDDRGGRIEVGSCAFFPGVRIECWRGATIRIGSGTYLNRGTEIVAAHSVTIGRDCKIARDVIIMDTDQHGIRGGTPPRADVVIGDRVWIGARAIVLKGVAIGDDSVVGAGAVVSRDVPARTVVAGSPARVIRTLLEGG
jgi:acetyltransferase-like isoleucine patch superfamily enzyme